MGGVLTAPRQGPRYITSAPSPRAELPVAKLLNLFALSFEVVLLRRHHRAGNLQMVVV